jgi:3-methylfumaryl-CoA hydratase
MENDAEQLERWVGRTEILSDEITTFPAAALSATLDRGNPAPQPGDPLPPCWHWLYFQSPSRQSEIGPDGHPRRGGFLPPIDLPRRMWAGSQVEWRGALRIGEKATKASRILEITRKVGRDGPLVFVRVRHQIDSQSAPIMIEDQDIVYRNSPTPGEAPRSIPAPAKQEWERIISPDPVMLFRYSALTFNGHRIHFDHRYATEVEGYPGLVVHGPLIATLLLELLHQNLPTAQVSRFSFRAVKPTFDLTDFSVCDTRAPNKRLIFLWAKHPDGTLAMDATATLG